MSIKDRIGKGILDGLNEMEDVTERPREKVSKESSDRHNVALKYRGGEYNDYKQCSVSNAVAGDGIKVNFNFDKETLQKLKYLLISQGVRLKEYLFDPDRAPHSRQFSGEIDLRDYSEVPAAALALFYEIYFLLKQNGIDVFAEELAPEEIVKKLAGIREF